MVQTLLDAVTHHPEHFAAADRDTRLRRSAEAGRPSPHGQHARLDGGIRHPELITRMGHSSSRAALIHQHMTSDRDRAIADRFGAMIRGGGGAATPEPSEKDRAGS